MQPMCDAMVSEGMPYQGVLYGGFMLTKDGVKTNNTLNFTNK